MHVYTGAHRHTMCLCTYKNKTSLHLRNVQLKYIYACICPSYNKCWKYGIPKNILERQGSSTIFLVLNKLPNSFLWFYIYLHTDPETLREIMVNEKPEQVCFHPWTPQKPSVLSGEVYSKQWPSSLHVDPLLSYPPSGPGVSNSLTNLPPCFYTNNSVHPWVRRLVPYGLIPKWLRGHFRGSSKSMMSLQLKEMSRMYKIDD